MPLDNAIALENILRENLEDMLTPDGIQNIAIIDRDDFILLKFSFVDAENYNKFIHFVLSNTAIDFLTESNPFQKTFNIKILENTTVTTDILISLLNNMQQPLPAMHRTFAFRGVNQFSVSVVTPESSQESDLSAHL